MDRSKEIPPELREVFDRNAESAKRAEALARGGKDAPDAGTEPEREECEYCSGDGGCRYCGFGRGRKKKKAS